MRALVLTGPVGTFTWRMLATVMGGQAVAVFFGALVARALAAAGGGEGSTTYLLLFSALSLGCLLAAGLMRGRWGVTLGWLVQLATLAAALVVPMMVAVAVIFTGLWVLCLVQGHRIDARVAEARGPERADGPAAPEGPGVPGDPGRGPAGAR